MCPRGVPTYSAFSMLNNLKVAFTLGQNTPRKMVVL